MTKADEVLFVAVLTAIVMTVLVIRFGGRKK